MLPLEKTSPDPCWLALHFPHLALDLFTRGQARNGLPIAISDSIKRRELIIDCNPAALGGGVKPGMPVTAALGLMDSEYIYPELGDRLQPSLWEELGAQDIRERARANVEQILSTHYPNYIDPAVDAKIRDAYNIVLDPDAMKPGNARW